MGKLFKKTLFIRLVFFLQWLIFLSCFKRYHGKEVDDEPCVILFWHGRLALMPFAFRRFRKKGKRAFVMISHHRDGEFIAKLIHYYGLNVVRGSTFRGASTALRSAFKVLEQKDDIVITPDGPRGPRHSISDGAILIAQKKNVKIRILNYEASRFWEFKSWDKMLLPKPFSRVVYSLSEPFDVSNLEKDEAKVLIKKEFEKICQRDSFKEQI
ncbi:lysophospholipid acyltransferase family protein [Campylobacter felis]|uniref:Lysophospholipid acyltransferase family protein n=1 Tax=Campylobacter felis TaxID=2974565 RepID=A0ABT7I2A0_9BACT|nr:lysophospholipid acyltransferase family protein [Campylobacter felis]MDL0146218.1 lysophospholipid acyltransferase family protein [Campylobacter felis]